MRILIKNGLVIDPVKQSREIRNIYIENGIFVSGNGFVADREIDAEGKAVMPGLIDAHCHLREPGFEYREDIVSGTRSAARGGFTTIACMPNTSPVCDNAAIVEYIIHKAEEQGSCRVLPIGAVTKGQKGSELAEIGLMAEAGIVAVSDDGRPVEQSDMMRKAMIYANQFGLRVISHCEDMSLADGHMNEGIVSTELGLKGIPAAAEEIMVARDIILSEYLNIPIHLAHLSTARSIDLVRMAKDRGVPVTCETCPHYFTLNEEAVRGFNTMAKMNPPLRPESDREAIIAGLVDGTIDIIATDHAPHHADEKEIEFALANNGIVGFETAFALAYTWLVRSGRMSLEKMLAKFTTDPAKILGQKLGTIDSGSPADLIIADLENSFVFDKKQIVGKAKNTPYDGFELYGKIVMTVQGGKIRYEA
ncbi:MAG: dihydroorotase [Eubacteriales bacterium]|jgi:dihydroorotase|nr:dihydroorotase [Eubacteriales bacterium]MDD3197096.1 dihydroorotase [Eubacteriales bacterium]MDD4681596.1 dihydroorotase [Eubacteriales bacterium]